MNLSERHIEFRKKLSLLKKVEINDFSYEIRVAGYIYLSLTKIYDNIVWSNSHSLLKMAPSL